jgi:TIR domain
MDVDKWFVTINGECFEAEFQGEERDGRRIGSVHLFRLRDVRSGRGELLVSVFRSEQIKLLNPNYLARVEFVRINVIRRAFDAGKLSFDEPYEEHMYRSLDMKDSDFQQQPLASDPAIRQFIVHKAYWLSYMHPTNPGLYPVSFDAPEDLDYLGATQADVRRNVVRLVNQGMLDKVMDKIGRPTEKLIAGYESAQESTASEDSRDTLHDMPPQPPATHRGLSIFISHSSKDADLALALIDLLKAALALRADQIRCSSVDGYRLPVGVNTESKLREEVNAAKVAVGLITPNSLASYYVMFELGARWGADLFLAPLMAGVKAGELSGPLSC